jgi:hypothetical protein
MLILVHLDLHDGRPELMRTGACRSFQYLYVILSMKRGCAMMGEL